MSVYKSVWNTIAWIAENLVIPVFVGAVATTIGVVSLDVTTFQKIMFSAGQCIFIAMFIAGVVGIIIRKIEDRIIDNAFEGVMDEVTTGVPLNHDPTSAIQDHGFAILSDRYELAKPKIHSKEGLAKLEVAHKQEVRILKTAMSNHRFKNPQKSDKHRWMAY